MPLSPSYTLGLIFIFLVSLIWAAASVLVQFVYSDKFSFDSPFLLTYTGVSLFTCFLPARWITDQWNKIVVHPIASTPLPTEDLDLEITPSSTILSQEGERNPDIWTTRDHIFAAAKIAPVWFISNYSYNASLKYTSITSSTVLASTGSLFTFLFALLARDEHFSLYKFFGIVLGMTGSILTGLHDIGDKESQTGESSQVLWGDFLGLLSAVGYGGYTILVRVLCPRDESLMSMQLFLGFVGLWNLVFLSPIAIYQGCFQATGLTWFIFGCLIVKGLFDNVLSDYLWARAVILTSATVATVGLGLTIPLAFASDVVMGRSNVLDASSIIGAISVLSGFVLVNLGQQQEEEEEQTAEVTHEQFNREVEYCDGPEANLVFRNGNGVSRLPMSLDPYRDEPEEVGYPIGGTE